MELMYITNDEIIAKEAEQAGVDRIFIDLEINGKLERQGHLDTHITNHKINDIKKIKKVLTKSKLIARINPIYEDTKREIDECIEQGADIIMLPMIKTSHEVEQFIEYVNTRAMVCLLIETSQAMVRINQILEINGIDEVYIGLNDLHLSLGLDFMFELLSEGLVEHLGELIQFSGIKFGFGGIAKIGQGDIPPKIILGEHYRIGSELVILSRTFRNLENSGKIDINEEIKKIREVENEIKTWSAEEFLKNNLSLKEMVRKIVDRKRKNS